MYVIVCISSDGAVVAVVVVVCAVYICVPWFVLLQRVNSHNHTHTLTQRK